MDGGACSLPAASRGGDGVGCCNWSGVGGAAEAVVAGVGVVEGEQVNPAAIPGPSDETRVHGTAAPGYP